MCDTRWGATGFLIDPIVADDRTFNGSFFHSSDAFNLKVLSQYMIELPQPYYRTSLIRPHGHIKRALNPNNVAGIIIKRL